jgi:hypothetical protein
MQPRNSMECLVDAAGQLNSMLEGHLSTAKEGSEYGIPKFRLGP